MTTTALAEAASASTEELWLLHCAGVYKMEIVLILVMVVEDSVDVLSRLIAPLEPVLELSVPLLGPVTAAPKFVALAERCVRHVIELRGLCGGTPPTGIVRNLGKHEPGRH